jgi:hypothetical protein
MFRKVDPAALLFSIFTVTFSPLTTSGPWAPLNTALAIVVGTVLAAFTWPRKETLEDERGKKITQVDGWVMFSQALAYGLIIAIGIAWIVQWIWLQASPSDICKPYPNGRYQEACLTIADHVTWVCLAGGLVAAIILFYRMRKRTAKILDVKLGPVLRPWLRKLLLWCKMLLRRRSMTGDMHAALAELRDGPLYRFADWPNPAVPNGRIGVYTVWRDDQFVYVGMAGRAIGLGLADSEPASGRLTGIRSRLASHASGLRSGDQFCVYVFDRMILATLSREQIDGAARGQLSLDEVTRQLIRQSLSYRFTLLKDAETARAAERQIQREGLASQPPLLNPLRGAPQSRSDG